MRYEDEDLEIIDAFEDMKPISHTKVKKTQKKENSKELKKKESKQHVKQQKENKILFRSIVFLPIFSFIYLISTNSKILINNRISIFSLVMIVILSISLIIGIIKEFSLQRKILSKILKLTSSLLYVSIFV